MNIENDNFFFRLIKPLVDNTDFRNTNKIKKDIIKHINKTNSSIPETPLYPNSKKKL